MYTLSSRGVKIIPCTLGEVRDSILVHSAAQGVSRLYLVHEVQQGILVHSAVQGVYRLYLVHEVQ